MNQKISEGKNSAPHSGQSFVNHMSSKVLLEHNMRMIEGTLLLDRLKVWIHWMSWMNWMNE